jgi:hypothetical protein
MRLLTATHRGQGDRDGDFCFATGGELVLVPDACARDRNDPDGGCGCGRSFAGMNSHRATTTAMVRDVDLSHEDLRLAVAGYFTAGGMGPDVVGEKDFADLVDEVVDETVGFGRPWPVGTVVGRRLDRVSRRSFADGAGPWSRDLR